MKSEKDKLIVAALLERHGQTFSHQLEISLERNMPASLFQWLCAALLMSARIPSQRALQAAAALKEAGWTTAKHMADSEWKDRVKVLNSVGYARFDKSAARMLGKTAELLLDKYHGDLRKLREKAKHHPASEKRLLTEFKGIGNLGADIFLREVQLVWKELYPFADRKALDAARQLGLADTAEGLAALVPRQDFPRLIAALIRVSLLDDLATIAGRKG